MVSSRFNISKKILRNIVLSVMLPLAAGPLNVEAKDFSKLVILHTNDTHGFDFFEDRKDGTGFLGIGAIAGLKKDLETKGYEVLLLDAGDCSQDNMLVNFSEGLFAFKLYNMAKYDAICLGNHEFDYGQDILLRNMKEAAFPVLSSNIIVTATGLPFTITSAIIKKGENTIGIVGFTTPNTINSTAKGNVEGLEFFKEEKLYECARTEIQKLKDSGCDLIIGLGHMGSEEANIGFRSDDILLNTDGFDIFIDGHDHVVKNRRVNGTLLVEAGSYTMNAGFIEYKDGTFVENMKTFDEIKGKYGSKEIDKAITAELQAIEKYYGKIIGKSDVLLDASREPGLRTREMALGDLTADAMLWQANEALKLSGKKVHLAIINGGGIRHNINKGDIKISTIREVLPYPNQLNVITLKGEKILELLECATQLTPKAMGGFPQVSGIRFKIDTSVPYLKGDKYAESEYYAPLKPGSRVSIEEIDGKPFEKNKMYNLVVTDFQLKGGDTYSALYEKSILQSRVVIGYTIFDALLNYIQTELNGNVNAEYQAPDGRIDIK